MICVESKKEFIAKFLLISNRYHDEEGKQIFASNYHVQLVRVCAKVIRYQKLYEQLQLLYRHQPRSNDEKNELEEQLFDKIQVKYLQFPFTSIAESVFFTPTLIPYRLPTIETFTSLTNERIKVNE